MDSRFRPCGRNAEIHSRRRLTSPTHRGERGAAVKPLRRECRMFRPTCTDLWAPFLFSPQGLRVRPAPGIPCALCLRERRLEQSSDAKARRGDAKSCGFVIASEAKQSIAPRALKHGVRRRCAPRGRRWKRRSANTGCHWRSEATMVRRLQAVVSAAFRAFRDKPGHDDGMFGCVGVRLEAPTPRPASCRRWSSAWRTRHRH